MHASPYLIAALAVSCYALLGPLAKKVSLVLPPFSFIAASSLILFLICFALAVAYERPALSTAIRHINFGWLLCFSLVNILGYIGYLWAINRIAVAEYQMFIILGPIVGGAFAYILLGETFHTRYLIAAAIMAIGLYIAISPRLT